jgi:hypothetical protein
MLCATALGPAGAWPPHCCNVRVERPSELGEQVLEDRTDLVGAVVPRDCDRPVHAGSISYFLSRP